jgi:predicted DNA-binding ribbon-helix-helix protein
MMTSTEVQTAEDNEPKGVRSTLVSRNMTIAGHRTSVRLEPEMWSGLSEICRRERTTLHEVGTTVSMRKQQNTSLTAAIRVFVMAYFRSSSTEDGHSRAGHGYGLTGNMSGTAVNGVTSQLARPSPQAQLTVVSGKLDTGTRRY